MNDKITAEWFLKDVSTHELTVLQNEGARRHIRLARKGSSTYQFDLITWPGYLCYCGDMGTYVFRRLPDMFEFFRSDSGRLEINPGYWSEKVESESRFGNGVQAFSHELFESTVLELADEFIKDEGLSRYWVADDPAEIEQIFRDEIAEMISSVETGQDAYEAVTGYIFQDLHDLEARSVFGQDSWELNFSAFTHHYLWCCYAIVWGIQQFDKYEKSLGDDDLPTWVAA